MKTEQGSPAEEPEYFTPAEVAKLFSVDPGTVSRWANEGKLPHVRTLGGHRRFPAKAITELLNQPGVDE